MKALAINLESIRQREARTKQLTSLKEIAEIDIQAVSAEKWKGQRGGENRNNRSKFKTAQVNNRGACSR
jgi:hypothetical protein